MSAALPIQGAGLGGQPPVQPQITSEMIMEIFNIEEEQALMILQTLPQLCQAAQPQIQQGAEIGAIQMAGDIADFQGFLNTINSPLITDQERKWLYQLDAKTMFEVVKGTGMLATNGTPTADALSRISWSDATAKNPNAKDIAKWILEILMPRIINPLIQGQEQLMQVISAMVEEQYLQQAATQQQFPGQGPAPGQGIGVGGQPQYQNQPPAQGQEQGGQSYPWKNSNGDSLKIFTDATGKKWVKDSMNLDIVKDSIKIDENGTLTGDAVMTAAMVQTYMRDGKEQKVLKDPGELKKACDIWILGMPCTDQHPAEGIVMNQDEITGWTTPPQWDTESQTVKCSFTIHDGRSVKRIQDGGTDVSIGFFCDLHEDAGKFEDTAYDAVQRNIVFNHLAVGLDKGKGRCPDGTCGIQTDKKEKDIDWEQYKDIECVGDTHYDWLSQDMEEDETLTEEEREALPEEDFCGPGRSFPINDCAHYTAAMSMLDRYQGPGDKTEIKDSIIQKGKSLDCPGAADEELALHKQLLKESMEALVAMTKKLAEEGTTLPQEELEDLLSGIRELMWKLQDEMKVVKGRNIAVGETPMTDARKAYGDAAILQHTITNPGGTPVAEGKYRLEPGIPDTHDHYVDLDAEGNGTSTENDGHTHMVEKMVVKLTDEHTHQLVPSSSEEEPSMTDKEKIKAEKDKAAKLAADKAAAEAAAKETPKNKAKSGDDEAEPPAEKPAEKDEASLYVDAMIKKEHATLVDAIMDCKPPQERELFEKKSLDELKELKDILDAVTPEGQTITAGSGNKAEADAVNDAYTKLEDKLQDR